MMCTPNSRDMEVPPPRKPLMADAETWRGSAEISLSVGERE